MTGSLTNSGADFSPQLRSPLDLNIAGGALAPVEPLRDPLNSAVTKATAVNIATSGDEYLTGQPGGSRRWDSVGTGLASFNATITGTPIPATRKSPQPDNGSQPDENGNQGISPKLDAVYFADINGDGTDDAIAVNNWGTTVRFSNGTNQFLPNTELTPNPFFGSKRTYFTDVTGDGRADGIVVNNDGVYVRAYDGTGFANPVKWTEQGYFGDKGTFFADVNGDGMADAIVVNSQQGPVPGITVRLSTGNSFSSNQHWINESYFGDKGTFFADVNGDSMADAIVVNSENRPGIDGVFVRLSTGNGFGAAQRWTNEIYYGDKGTFFADVNGDGMADAIAVNSEAALRLQGVTVRLSTGSNFGTPATQEKWTDNAYYGDKGIYFADVTGDGQADAIVSNKQGVGDVVGVTVRPSNGSDFLSNQNWTNGFPYYGTGGHGSLIRAIGQPEVYLIEGNERRHIPDPETLAGLRQGRPIQELSIEDLNSIPLGVSIPSSRLTSPPPLGLRSTNDKLNELLSGQLTGRFIDVDGFPPGDIYQCWDLVAYATGNRALTSTWKRGENVMANGNVAIGTAIATFLGPNNSYNHPALQQHTAIFAGYGNENGVSGFYVWDQNFDVYQNGDFSIKKHFIWTNSSGTSDADNYYVIQV
jgi:hypothetical protein